MPPKENKWIKIKNELIKRGRILFYAACLGTTTGFLGRYFMIFELTSHFRMQYFIILFLAAAVYCLEKKWILYALAMVFLTANAFVVLPWYIPEKNINPPPAGESVHLLFSNVFTSNDNYSSLIDLIEQESPDIIVLQEVDNRWVQALKKLAEKYPDHEFHPRRDNFGIAVLSRIPLQNMEIKSFTEEEIPHSIVANVQLEHSTFKLIATHPVPPATPKYFARRNEQLTNIAQYVTDQNTPCVIVGDLNLTMWSCYHDNLLSQTGLKNARQGFGIKPTWPTTLPPFYVPLDHCLCPSDMIVKDFGTTSRIGSDHLPFIVDLLIPFKDQGY
ncbi:MAG: endonuclease/exonuclease/phosphatase family protein [Planctomycetes bacterium]|nr:endonuclease/exonuclease/phosphatase family protein [Planctomycetota bacterium]